MGGEDCGLGGGGQRRGEDLARLRSPPTIDSFRPRDGRRSEEETYVSRDACS